jgi:hypothetical protein
VWGVLSGVMKWFWNWTEAMVVQHYECTNAMALFTFKWLIVFCEYCISRNESIKNILKKKASGGKINCVYNLAISLSQTSTPKKSQRTLKRPFMVKPFLYRRITNDLIQMF